MVPWGRAAVEQRRAARTEALSTKQSMSVQLPADNLQSRMAIVSPSEGLGQQFLTMLGTSAPR